MLRVAIILGSTRPGRNGEAVAKWVYDIAKKRTEAEFEYVDIKDYNLPLYDEPTPGQYTHEHTKRWAAKIGSFDAFVFVTAEYNHGIPGALKNAIDFLYKGMEQQSSWVCQLWRCWRCALCRTATSGDGRAAVCNRSCPSRTVTFYRL